MHCRMQDTTIQGAKRYAQMLWETRVRLRPNRGRVVDTQVLGNQSPESDDLALEGRDRPRATPYAKVGSRTQRTRARQRPNKGGKPQRLYASTDSD